MRNRERLDAQRRTPEGLAKARAKERDLYRANPKYAVSCKQRAKRWATQNRERIKEHRQSAEYKARRREQRKAHSEKENAAALKRYYANRERYREQNRAWKENNRDRTREMGRAWQQRNLDRLRRRAKERYQLQEVRERRAHWQNARRLRQLTNGGAHTLAEWRHLVELHDHRCAYCGRNDRRLSRDHIRPVSRGGRDDISNILPACRPCNSAKGARTAAEFILWKQTVSNHMEKGGA